MALFRGRAMFLSTLNSLPHPPNFNEFQQESLYRFLKNKTLQRICSKCNYCIVFHLTSQKILWAKKGAHYWFVKGFFIFQECVCFTPENSKQKPLKIFLKDVFNCLSNFFCTNIHHLSPANMFVNIYIYRGIFWPECLFTL